jgi:hypothetical protein
MLAHLLLLAQLAGAGSFSGAGGINSYSQPVTVISALAQSVDANTVVLTWTTDIASDSRGHCGTHESPDDGVQSGVTSHVLAVAGLAPSTLYSCTIQSGSTTQAIAATTSALAASTPITGISIGSFTNYNSTSPPNTMSGDTYYNTRSNDGVTYMLTMDTSGWNGMPGLTSALQIAKFTNESPIVGSTVNYLSGFTGAPVPTAKAGGLMSIGGVFYILLNRLSTDVSNIYETITSGSMMMSPDHGATINNYQNPTTYTTTGANLKPQQLCMWPQGNPNTNWSSNHFVMYGADDGTLGYQVANNRFNDANEYVYIVSLGYGTGSHSSVNNNDNAYLMRVPRSKIGRMNPTDYQYYVSGDGNLDSNWSSISTNAGAILTNAGKLGWMWIQYVPVLNRYLLLTFYYPSGAGAGGANNSVWLEYESPTPWGTWTQIGTQTFTGTGYYSPMILTDTALSAGFSPTTMTVLTTQSFLGSGYNMFYGTMTVTH